MVLEHLNDHLERCKLGVILFKAAAAWLLSASCLDHGLPVDDQPHDVVVEVVLLSEFGSYLGDGRPVPVLRLVLGGVLGAPNLEKVEVLFVDLGDEAASVDGTTVVSLVPLVMDVSCVGEGLMPGWPDEIWLSLESSGRENMDRLHLVSDSVQEDILHLLTRRGEDAAARDVGGD